MLEEAFDRNWDEAVIMIDAMFKNKVDFKWICELRASLEPRVIESDGSFAPKMVMLVRNDRAVAEETSLPAR